MSFPPPIISLVRTTYPTKVYRYLILQDNCGSGISISWTVVHYSNSSIVVLAAYLFNYVPTWLFSWIASAFIEFSSDQGLPTTCKILSINTREAYTPFICIVWPVVFDLYHRGQFNQPHWNEMGFNNRWPHWLLPCRSDHADILLLLQPHVQSVQSVTYIGTAVRFESCHFQLLTRAVFSFMVS